MRVYDLYLFILQKEQKNGWKNMHKDNNQQKKTFDEKKTLTFVHISIFINI